MRCLHVLDTAIIYSVFLSGFHGDVAAVRKLIDSFNISSEHYLRPLVSISRAEGDPELLRVCFENGFVGTMYEQDHLLSSRVHKNPSTAWLDVLFDADFRQWRTDPQQLCRQETWLHIPFMGVDCTRWWIKHGGRSRGARGLFERTKEWPGSATIRILLDGFGVDWFSDSGTLQLAAKNDDLETVIMLVEAGANIDELVTDWQMDIREHRAAPILAIQEAFFAKSERTIRYLAEHGAKLPRRNLHINDPYQSLREDLRAVADLVLELGAVTDETSP